MKLYILALLFLGSWGRPASARCPSDVLIMYHMILQTEWSETKFPKQYPEWRPPAQWSVVIGRSHNSSGILWRIGTTVTDPVKQFVETGKVDMLIREGAEQKKGILSEFFAPPIPQGVGISETKYFADAAHSKVSLMCRIIPSPDWFIGVDSFDLCKGEKWLESVTLDLHPIDGGTDSGYTFTSPKWATIPRSNITIISSKHPNHPANSFFYPDLEELPPIATVKFLKLKEFYLNKQILRNLQTEVSSGDGFLSAPLEEFKIFPEKQNQRPKPKKERKIKLRQLPLAQSLKMKNGLKKKIATNAMHQKNRPRPCRVDDWSEWSPCSQTCGFGEQQRVRHVTHFASKGGRPCPALHEKRWCRGSGKCPKQSSGFFRWQ